LKHVDPRFTLRLRFVKETEDIILSRAIKMAFQLRILKPPYKKEKVLVPSIGVSDFETSYVKITDAK
jgi:hypothetical protein